MGTSTDRTAGSGGDWTPLKTATAAYIRGLRRPDSPQRARRLLARHVPLLGGPTGASSSATAGRAGAARLGALLTGLAAGTTAATLREAGLAHLIGADRFTVLDELITYLAGTGSDLDSVAARDAACDVLDEVFDDAETWADLENITVDRDDLHRILERFLTLYIYNRVPVVAERLAKTGDPAALRAADREMRTLISDFVVISMPDDPMSVDWHGPAGQAIVDRATDAAYRALSALD